MCDARNSVLVTHSCQIPNGDSAGFAANYECSSIRKELARPDVVVPLQAVQLRDGAFGAWLADVPDLDTALASCVDIFGWVAYGDSTHYFSVGQCVDLPCVSWNACPYQCIWWKWHWLHLTFSTHVK